MNVNLTENDITALKQYASNNPKSNFTNNSNPNENRKYLLKNDTTIVFPAFDLSTNLSTNLTEFGNENARLTTVA